MAPAVLNAGIGDEVRWVNHRSDDVRIDFLGDALQDVSCHRGSTSWMGTQKESATVRAKKSASFCFTKGGVVTYNVLMDSPLPGGKQITQSEVRVGSPRGSAAAH